MSTLLIDLSKQMSLSSLYLQTVFFSSSLTHYCTYMTFCFPPQLANCCMFKASLYSNMFNWSSLLSQQIRHLQVLVAQWPMTIQGYVHGGLAQKSAFFMTIKDCFIPFFGYFFFPVLDAGMVKSVMIFKLGNQTLGCAISALKVYSHACFCDLLVDIQPVRRNSPPMPW